MIILHGSQLFFDNKLQITVYDSTGISVYGNIIWSQWYVKTVDGACTMYMSVLYIQRLYCLLHHFVKFYYVKLCT